LLALFFISSARASVLGDVLERVAKGYRPVVVFDLDDTLFDSRSRKLAILKEFVGQESVSAAFPEETAIIQAASSWQLRYRIEDSLASLGIADPGFSAAAIEFWKSRFFTSPYCEIDSEVPGAASFLTRLQAVRGHIVYLTGRDRPRMEWCTLAALYKKGFPLDGTTLLMKPRKELDDLEFKKESFEFIAKLGQVEAAFENEPRNANALKAAFPKSSVIFLNTINSGSGILDPSIPRIPDFQSGSQTAPYRKGNGVPR
jgi:hypothetical protein